MFDNRVFALARTVQVNRAIRRVSQNVFANWKLMRNVLHSFSISYKPSNSRMDKGKGRGQNKQNNMENYGIGSHSESAPANRQNDMENYGIGSHSESAPANTQNNMGNFGMGSRSESAPAKTVAFTADPWQNHHARQFLVQSRAERRKNYRCGNNFKTLEDVPMFSAYSKVYGRKGKLERDAYAVNLELASKVSMWSGDITTLEVDAIVNAANCSLVGGGGVDGAIHEAAGSTLVSECITLRRCETGSTKLTGGHMLPARYILHTVGPQGHRPQELENCYRSCLQIARERNLRTIAFCCISTGIYGYPNEPAAHVALNTVRRFLEKFGDEIDRIIFCTFLQRDFSIYEELMSTKYFPCDRSQEDQQETDLQSGVEESKTHKTTNDGAPDVKQNVNNKSKADKSKDQSGNDSKADKSKDQLDKESKGDKSKDQLGNESKDDKSKDQSDKESKADKSKDQLGNESKADKSGDESKAEMEESADCESNEKQDDLVEVEDTAKTAKPKKNKKRKMSEYFSVSNKSKDKSDNEPKADKSKDQLGNESKADKSKDQLGNESKADKSKDQLGNESKDDKSGDESKAEMEESADCESNEKQDDSVEVEDTAKTEEKHDAHNPSEIEEKHDAHNASDIDRSYVLTDDEIKKEWTFEELKELVVRKEAAKLHAIFEIDRYLIDLLTKDNESLPFTAVESNAVLVMNTFIHFGFDPSEMITKDLFDGENDMTVFHYASFLGNLEILKLLIRYEPEGVMARDDEQDTPFHHAVVNEQIDVMDFLLKQPNCDVNEIGGKGFSSLLLACCLEKDESFKFLLKQQDIDVNLKETLEGRSALHFACSYGRADYCAILLKNPTIDVNMQDVDGDTGLHDACCEGNIKCVGQLLQHNDIKIDIKNGDGKTAEDVTNDKNIKKVLSKYKARLDKQK